MSYISTIRHGDQVIVWERNQGVREVKHYDAPYYFYVKSNNGQHQSIYGDTLERYDFDTAVDFQQARAEFQKANTELFESDIPPELKVLSEHYYNAPVPDLHITFYDIEVDYSKELGFASAHNPYAPINSVALYHQHQDRYVLLAVPPETEPELQQLTKDNKETGVNAPQWFKDKVSEYIEAPKDCEIILCQDERELLLLFLVEIEDSDIISGWNSDFFDTPYLGKRLEKYSSKLFRKLSFPEGNKPSWREVEVLGNVNETLDLSGRISADYMVVFRKYEVAERQSYKLESVADDFLPDMPKIEYEGSLASLYRDDFAKFIRYNIRDTEILHGLEDLLGYIDLANKMYHMSTGVWKHVTGTLKLAEHATINYCHHELGGLVVNDIHPAEENASIQGAFVLDPKVGLHEWIGSIDINSLYPSSIRSLNISPEKLIGQFTQKTYAAEKIAEGCDITELVLLYDDGSHEQFSAADWQGVLAERQWAISGYGTVFDQSSTGIIPEILAKWYATRKEYKAEAGKADKNGEKSKAMYYDKLQYVYKIKLNSFYGALTNQYFRFYDLRMGESTTGTGRMILKHQCAKANEIMTGEYDDAGEAVIYGDTDSSYFKTYGQDVETAIKIADRVGELITESFPEFMRQSFLCQPGFDDIIQAGREIVSDRGIFVDKKRYILHIVDNEGKRVDKLKVMGLDTKKTTLPKPVSDHLNHFVERYLKGEDWDTIAQDIVDYKDHLTNTDVMSIGLPKGVKKVEHYTQEYKLHGDGARLPGHIAAAIFYNICRDHYEDKESMEIQSGMKIKVFYLKNKVGRFKSIAVPVDLEQIPSWFLDNFAIDYDAHIERLVDKPLRNIIKAVGKEPPTRQSLLTEDLLDF